MSEQQRNLRLENDLYINEMKIVAYTGAEYDLRYLYATIRIQEDIFSGFMSGSIHLIDAMDLPQLLPIIGQEKLILNFTLPDKNKPGTLLPDYNHTFRVYKVESRKTFGTNTQGYTLHFCSQEMLNAMKKKISRGFVKKNVSEIVENIYNEFKVDKPLIVEPTRDVQNFVVPFWNPLKAINALSARAISAENDGSAYVFFENHDEFKFISLNKLMEQAPIETYNYRVANLADGAKRTTDKEYARVQSLQHAAHMDVLSHLQRGLYQSKVITVNTINRTFDFGETDRTQFDLRKAFTEKFKTLETKKPFRDDLDAFGDVNAHARMVFTNDGIDQLNPDETPKHIEDYILRRSAQFHLINMHRMHLNMSGDPRIRAGHVIEFEAPRNLGLTSPEKPYEPDVYLTGKFLVTALSHVFTPATYHLALEVVKDSYLTDIEHVDVIELYKDIY